MCNFLPTLAFILCKKQQPQKMENYNIKQLLNDILHAIQPIAKQKNIQLYGDTTEPLFEVNLPMDEVLNPVFSLILKLIYILPAGRNLTLKATQRQDVETKSYFLRISIITQELFFNPNLIFKADNNRFKIESKGNNQSSIFMEWSIDMSMTPMLNPPSIDIVKENNKNLMDSKIINHGVVQRFQEYGGSYFIQDKLKATKSRKEEDFLSHIQNIIIKNLGNIHFSSEVLEKEAAISKAQLFRKLKGLTGFSTANYIRHFRLQKAVELLETTETSISHIAEKVGFNDLSYFSSSFMEQYHISSTEWRKGLTKMKQ